MNNDVLRILYKTTTGKRKRWCFNSNRTIWCPADTRTHLKTRCILIISKSTVTCIFCSCCTAKLLLCTESSISNVWSGMRWGYAKRRVVAMAGQVVKKKTRCLFFFCTRGALSWSIEVLRSWWARHSKLSCRRASTIKWFWAGRCPWWRCCSHKLRPTSLRVIQDSTLDAILRLNKSPKQSTKIPVSMQEH